MKQHGDLTGVFLIQIGGSDFNQITSQSIFIGINFAFQITDLIGQLRIIIFKQTEGFDQADGGIFGHHGGYFAGAGNSHTGSGDQTFIQQVNGFNVFLTIRKS